MYRDGAGFELESSSESGVDELPTLLDSELDKGEFPIDVSSDVEGASPPKFALLPMSVAFAKSCKSDML